jgi:hypothetical protein
MILDHERLDVYRLALDFLVFANQVIETLRSHLWTLGKFSANCDSAWIAYGHGHGHAYDPDQNMRTRPS